MKSYAALAIAIAVLPVFAFAQDNPANVRIEMQVVAIPEEIGVPLITELMDEQKIESAYARIQELLAKGKAQLLGWPIVTTHSGQRAVVEAIDEIRYATEFDPPTVSFTPSVNAAETIKIEPKADVTLFEAIPTTFETRNVGITLEVEPEVSADGKTIKLLAVPQHVRLKGYHKVTVEKPSTGGKIVVEQPDFDMIKVTTILTLKNGQRVLMGVFRVSEPPKHLEMFLLKAEAKKVE
jgi:type II secretory pathway component GspD/PulD (secretin)